MAEHNIPSRASAVVVGGGVTGASIAYHLARQGWQDVVLLERKQFTCGTTWHAAGLIGTMRANDNHARLGEYSMSLLNELERETGQSTGFRQVGSLSIAHSEHRWQELKRVASMNNAFGVTRVDPVTPEEVKNLFPLIDLHGILGGVWVAHDGKASPTDVTMAYIKAARLRGAQCIEGVTVTGVTRSADGKGHGRVTGVETDAGPIQCDYVVNAGGMWAREFGRMAGVSIPLHACEHYYAVTEKHADIDPNLPVLRDHDKCAYYREDAGSLLVGAFEKKAVAWGQHGIAEDFCFDELPGHMEEQLMPVLEDAMQRVPMLQNIGWRTFFCGPESFTPDDQFHLGEAPELRGYFVAAGLNSVGIQMSGGLGKACAEWMQLGHAPLDLWGNDIRRMYPCMNTQQFVQQRAEESLGLLYANHFPFRQFETSRNVRHSPLHERLEARGACFGQVAGWERPNWFAPEGVEAKYEYSFGKQNWFDYCAAEHRATREGVALYDQSSFSKYLLVGRDACAVLNRISSANIDVEPGRIVYTHWLNERGGIEADLTITRLSENEFWVISGAAVTHRDLDWLRRNTPDDAHCFVTDITNAWAMIGVMGPNSRAFLDDALHGVDLSADAFSFGDNKPVEIGCALGRATRVSYVGELGWELYVPVDQARHAFDHLLAKGESHGLKLAGLHALNTCRTEKKFVHYGHDIGDEDTPLEAGMGFVCNLDAGGNWIGREAIARQKESRSHMKKRFVQFLLQDPEAMLYHHEPIWRDGKIVGHLTSGDYGHTLGGSVGLGYVYADEEITTAGIEGSTWEIEVACERIAAKASLAALYDPRAERMRG